MCAATSAGTGETINAAWADAKKFGEMSVPTRQPRPAAGERRRKIFMYTASGQHITQDQGVPTLHDIARGLAFQCRFQGQIRRFYPHLSHVQVVADLLPRQWELFGLLHDASKACTGDWNPSFYIEDLRLIREHLQTRILWERFGIETIPEGAPAAVQIADQRATLAELRALGNPKVASWEQILGIAPPEDLQADECVQKWLDKYLVQDFLMPRGPAIRDYEMRVEAAWARWPR